ncbi:hypothetical protein [Legionella cincinnatiensis]|uniref:VipE n=1 Tax=Legionella cincinnatiensis TaxID=28085 RepID=A0A378ILU5_9GAMM|nr:hypothetical protein [Legionella cincinnatiensis]KTC89064.1 VipE [Legionella cincinnatiensis]STX35471.1 VipE [Legionella cincinnatiensis]
MPLQQTHELMKIYGESLKDGTISEQMLDQLLLPNVFKRAPESGYVDPNKPVTDSNHTQMDAIKDFVETVGKELSPEVLHTLTHRIIQRAPDTGENTFMRNSTLEKAFLAYEMALYPQLAESHFDSDRIKTTFPRESDIFKLKTVILHPLVEFFTYKNALQKLKEQLQQDTLNIQIREHAQKVVSQIEALKTEGKESIVDLTRILNNTQSLLKGEMPVKDYQTEAKTVQGKPSKGMKILGGLMIALGLAVAAVGVALAVTGIGVVAGAVTAAVGVGVLATGIGIFAKGRASGLSKAMDELALTTNRNIQL